MNRLAIILITLFSLVTTPAKCCTRVIVGQDDDFAIVFSKPNTSYIIKDDINLGGCKVVIGSGSTLVFRGGSLANGTVVGNNTRVKAGNYEIFKRGYVRYRAYISSDASKNDPPSLIKNYHNCLVVEGTWCNKKCGSNWTGLQNQSSEDVMLAVKNFVMLHSEGVKVSFPTIQAFGYESTKLPGGHVIDFNNSTISYPDNLDVWEDTSIAIPDGATACPMESGYGLLSLRDNTTVKNISIDGGSTHRQNEPVRLGVSCILSVSNAQNVTIDNVSISNVLGPAVTVQSKAKDITFQNCHFYNIGEHVVYSHQYLGYCHFVNCTFDTWDSERVSEHRNGLDYLYKHTPPVDKGVATYDKLYNFDLSFSECTFNNPHRLNEQRRTLGGFLVGSFPVVVRLNNCVFSGELPPYNTGGGSGISEKSGKAYRMIVKGCDGAPCIYSSKSSCNTITEFYDCVNIPFYTVYAKRYERCRLYLDVNEITTENVTSAFAEEFAEPLVMKNCEFIDRGKEIKVNHPVFHRPVIFDSCTMTSNIERNSTAEVVTVKSDSLSSVTFNLCQFDIPSFRLVGGNIAKDKISMIKCVTKAVKN